MKHTFRFLFRALGMPIFHFLCTFALPAFLGIWLIGAVAAWLAKVWEETKAQEE